MVPQEGLEPPRANAHYALNVARLPIPPLRQAFHKLKNYIMGGIACQITAGVDPSCYSDLTALLLEQTPPQSSVLGGVGGAAGGTCSAGIRRVIMYQSEKDSNRSAGRLSEPICTLCTRSLTP
jgi:hypothetical protein